VAWWPPGAVGSTPRCSHITLRVRACWLGPRRGSTAERCLRNSLTPVAARARREGCSTRRRSLAELRVFPFTRNLKPRLGAVSWPPHGRGKLLLLDLGLFRPASVNAAADNPFSVPPSPMRHRHPPTAGFPADLFGNFSKTQNGRPALLHPWQLRRRELHRRLQGRPHRLQGRGLRGGHRLPHHPHRPLDRQVFLRRQPQGQRARAGA